MTKQLKDQIPGKNASRSEIADFWDTHSVADYWDELKKVQVQFAKNLSEGITIRFDPQTLQSLREEAHKKGVGATTLIRMWVKERLRAEEHGMAT
jgi:predicted DNA binding CopG/RHH family protein